MSNSDQDITCRVFKKEGRYSGESEAIGCQSHECESEGHHGVMIYSLQYLSLQLAGAMIVGLDTTQSRMRCLHLKV